MSRNTTQMEQIAHLLRQGRIANQLLETISQAEVDELADLLDKKEELSYDEKGRAETLFMYATHDQLQQIIFNGLEGARLQKLWKMGDHIVRRIFNNMERKERVQQLYDQITDGQTIYLLGILNNEMTRRFLNRLTNEQRDRLIVALRKEVDGDQT